MFMAVQTIQPEEKTLLRVSIEVKAHVKVYIEPMNAGTHGWTDGRDK